MAAKTNTLPTPAHTSRLIPAKRAAAELGVPYSTLRDAHFRGELAVVRIGKGESHQAWYFERRELDRWIEANRDRPTPEAA